MSVNVVSAHQSEQPLSDGELVEQTLAGDDEAFSELVARHQKKAFRIALAIVRDAAEADVVTQDAFVQAYMNLSRFQRRAEFETWLTRIVINRSRDALRGRSFVSLSAVRSGEDAPQIDAVDQSPDAERQMIARQLNGAIERAVERLPAQQRVIFRLRHLEEMPLERIAELLGLRAGTVRAHLFRAVHRLRKELTQWLPGSRLIEEQVK